MEAGSGVQVAFRKKSMLWSVIHSVQPYIEKHYIIWQKSRLKKRHFNNKHITLFLLPFPQNQLSWAEVDRFADTSVGELRGTVQHNALVSRRQGHFNYSGVKQGIDLNVLLSLLLLFCGSPSGSPCLFLSPKWSFFYRSSFFRLP